MLLRDLDEACNSVRKASSLRLTFSDSISIAEDFTVEFLNKIERFCECLLKLSAGSS